MGIREALLGATVTPTEIVALPEIEAVVTVRGMTGVERDAFEASCIEGRGKRRDVNTKNMRAKLVAFCCVDEKGHRVFTDADAGALGEVRAGMSDQDAEDLGKPLKTKEVSDSSSSPLPVN